MESGENSQSIKMNRRKAIIATTGAGLAVAGLIKHKDIENKIIKHEDKNEIKDLLTNDWNEHIDSETSTHLFAKYNKEMDKNFFPNDEVKMDFFNKLTQLSAIINFQNKNLANQIAAIACYETKATFSPNSENSTRSGKGLFLLNDNNVIDFNLKMEQFGDLSPIDQLSLFGKVLLNEKKKINENFAFNDLSDLMMAKMMPTYMGKNSTDILWGVGTETYSINKEFDLDSDGEITKGEVADTIINFSVAHGEVESFLNNPNSPLVNKEEDIEEDPYKNDPTDEELESETKADMITAAYLAKIYSNSMNDKYFTTDERKLNFMRELTRISERLNEKQNPKNENLANQIAAVINFETAGSFSSSVKNPGSSATGLIQFMDFIAEEYDTTCEELAKMSPLKQLKYVEKYFSDKQSMALGNGWKGLWDISDVYMAVFWPNGMGFENSDALFDQIRDKNEYEVNAVLDINGDGIVQKQEATQRVIDEAVKRNEILTYLYAPGSTI